jgi:hypothetical protein
VPSTGLFWRPDEVCTVAELQAFLGGCEGAQLVQLVRPKEAGFWGVVVVAPPGRTTSRLTGR